MASKDLLYFCLSIHLIGSFLPFFLSALISVLSIMHYSCQLMTIESGPIDHDYDDDEYLGS